MQQVSGQGWKELKDSQERIEKLSFDCINQHDIVSNQIYDLTSNINEMMTKLDEMVYVVEDILQDDKSDCAGVDHREKPLKVIEKQLNEQMELLITLSQHFNDMMEQRSMEGEVVHELEGMVENQKKLVDHLLEYIN